MIRQVELTTPTTQLRRRFATKTVELCQYVKVSKVGFSSAVPICLSPTIVTIVVKYSSPVFTIRPLMYSERNQPTISISLLTSSVTGLNQMNLHCNNIKARFDIPHLLGEFRFKIKAQKRSTRQQLKVNETEY